MGYMSETWAVVLPFNPKVLANALTAIVSANAAMLRLCSKTVFLKLSIITSTTALCI